MPKVSGRIYCSSDWHNPPDKLKASVKAFIQEAKKGNADLVIGVGDLFDLMDYPWQDFISREGAIQELLDELGDLRFVYIEGNHDPLKWIKRVMANFEPQHLQIWSGPGIYELQLDGRRYQFTHGDQWAIDWKWLRKLSDLLVQIAPVEPVRRLWHWWVNRMNPGRIAQRIELRRARLAALRRGSAQWLREEALERKEESAYNRFVGWIHGGAGGHAETNDSLVVCGHTHKPWISRAWDSPRVYDDGDMVDSWSYLIIEGGGVTTCWLEGDYDGGPWADLNETLFDRVTLFVLLAGVVAILVAPPIWIILALAALPSLPWWLALLPVGAGIALFALGSLLVWVDQKLSTRG